MSNLISIHTFATKRDAQMAKGLLDEKEIYSVLKSDDCGGMHPEMTFTNGVQVLVKEEDAEFATETIMVLIKPSD